MRPSLRGLVLPARLRSAAQPHARQRPAGSATTTPATGRIVQASAGGVDLLTQDPRLVVRSRTDLLPGEHRLEDPLQAWLTGYPIVTEVDPALAPVRRGGFMPPTEWDMLTRMGSPSPKSDSVSDTVASPDGVSAFIARVLDQLTLSAWLPAALLTASVAILLEMRSAKSASILHAVGALTANPIRVLVIIIPLLVLATVVTQAFSFEAIRTLEGYWQRRGPASMARTLMIRWHVHRKNSIDLRLQRAYKEALDSVTQEALREKDIPSLTFDALKEILANEKSERPVTEQEKRESGSIAWESLCSAWHLAKIDQLLVAGDCYPDDNRILPTKLGNLMRATEDQLEGTDDDLQGFVLRRYASSPPRVQMQHDQYRNRLEMYCTLVFVSSSLVPLTLAILIGSGIGAAAISVISVSFAALSVASYLAAIASAAGYCAALREMDKLPDPLSPS